MTPFTIAGLLITITCFSLAAMILLQAPRSLLNRLMAYFNLSAGLWGLGTMLVGFANTPEAALWSWRLAHIGGLFLGIIFFHISLIIGGTVHRLIIKLGYVFAAISSLLCISGLAMSDIEPMFGGVLYHRANFLYGLLCSIWHLFVMYGHYKLFLAYRRAYGEERKRIKLVFYGMMIGFVGGMAVLWPMFGVPLYPYGNFLIPIYSVVVTYAIIRHQLLDIRIVIQKSLVYSLLIAVITATYLVAVLVIERLFQGVFGYESVVATVFVAFLIAIFFNPIRNKIQTFVDRRLFKATTPELAEQREKLLLEVRKTEQQKAVATLAAGMAHEIKNPLTAIKTFTEHLPEKFDSEEFRTKFNRIVGGEVERINHIVQQLLDFSKPFPPKFQPVHISELLDETLEFLNNEFIERRIEVTKNYDGVSTIQGDPQQLKQVFLNLFLNSMQAMNGNGRLIVKTEQFESSLRVTIQDNGSGVSQESLEHLFEPFYTTKPSGTGLGLSVVKGIVEEHGGEVGVDSKENEGMRVRVEMPISCI